jgi:hypothetical protein
MSSARFRSRNHPSQVRRRPHLEALEDRTLLSSTPAILREHLAIVVPGQRSAPATADVFDPTVVVNSPFTVTVARFTLPAVPLNSCVALDYSSSAPSAFTEQAIVDWGDGTLSLGVIESSGSGQFTVVGTHAYTAAGLYMKSTLITLPDQSTIVVSGAIEVFNPPLSGFGGFGGGGGLFSGGGGSGSTPNSPPASGNPGPSSPPVSANDHGSPAVSFQAILFSPAANTPIGPGSGASAPSQRTGYFYPPANAAPMSNSPPLRIQESGTREDNAGIVDVVPKPLLQDFASAPLRFSGVSEENAAVPTIAVKMPETSQPADLYPEDLLPALVCVRSTSDLLYAGLPDDELEHVTALALAGFTPALVGPVAEGLAQAGKPESDDDTKTDDHSVLAVEALVLVVCLCMWPNRRPEEATPVID